MKLILSLIDLIMVHEGKKTLRYIEKESLKENAVVEDRGSLSKPLVFIQQQETHALWRDYKLTTGSSSNQVKPVRMLDNLVKQRFFFGLLEPGQDIPDFDFMKKK